MNKRLLKKFFPLIAILLLAPWPVAYAYDQGAALAGEEPVKIEVAEPSTMPTWTVFRKAVGEVSPGDLFQVDATDNVADITVTLYLTNAHELVRHYAFLVLQIGVYVESDVNEWGEASLANGELIPDTFITLRDAEASFVLPGYTKYKVTIDDGSFRTNGNPNASDAAPQFYLTVR